eukprot:3873759-Prymnesium_polylepis.1
MAAVLMCARQSSWAAWTGPPARLLVVDGISDRFGLPLGPKCASQTDCIDWPRRGSERSVFHT